ncbi:hypothetical protein M436DRAFT_81911 [Aureobasidium namibiae CBS 147.97]|uniref:Cryptic loci regulator 2 N-terminal domain-containing protein n=1 Tax=Aureobasidium namibiae CBS 147.97 TaxID=1043004 RepID=A0A074WK82_9PEZI
MAAPNQAPNPGANTGPGPNPPTRDIDLSDPTFASDGQAQQPQVVDLARFLYMLSGAFRNTPNYAATLGYTANFTGGLPQGYVLELRARHPFSFVQDQMRAVTDSYVRGHPSGGSFRSAGDFAKHVYHIMRNDLVNCDCSLC